MTRVQNASHASHLHPGRSPTSASGSPVTPQRPPLGPSDEALVGCRTCSQWACQVLTLTGTPGLQLVTVTPARGARLARYTVSIFGVCRRNDDTAGCPVSTPRAPISLLITTRDAPASPSADDAGTGFDPHAQAARSPLGPDTCRPDSRSETPPRSNSEGPARGNVQPPPTSGHAADAEKQGASSTEGSEAR